MTMHPLYQVYLQGNYNSLVIRSCTLVGPGHKNVYVHALWIDNVFPHIYMGALFISLVIIRNQT